MNDFKVVERIGSERVETIIGFYNLKYILSKKNGLK